MDGILRETQILVARSRSLIRLYYAFSNHFYPIHHFSHLGPHKVSMPLPFAHTLGHGLEWIPKVDAIKKKDKSIYGHIQQENVPQNAKDGRDKHI